MRSWRLAHVLFCFAICARPLVLGLNLGERDVIGV